MPTFQYVRPDGKKPTPDEVPTRLSAEGREYDVDKEHCFEGPMKLADTFAMHGFKLRVRPTVEVKSGPKEKPTPPPAKDD